MDGIYRYQRFIYDATRAFYLLGRDGLIAALDVPPGGRALEVGCGTGRNLIHAARRYPSARLYGLDVSQAMLDTARRSIAKRGLAHRITCVQADATSFDPSRLFDCSSFDRVFISYALSMIPPWREVVVNAVRCLAPGGSVHIVDFGMFDGYPEAFRRAQLAWLKRFSVTPIPSFSDELSKLAADLGCSVAVEPQFRGYSLLARLARK
jgi:S-adenosylmethionine-diacylgycerolhomoserine-N-methlytransferase